MVGYPHAWGAQCNEALAFQLSKITQAGRQVCRFVLDDTSASGLNQAVNLSSI